jgi:hypothetical protein
MMAASSAASPRLPMFPFHQRRDGFPQPVIRGKHPVVAVPMFSRGLRRVAFQRVLGIA